MDVTIFLGMAVGISLIIFGTGIDSIVDLFVQPAALLIVLGGIIGASFIHFPFNQIKRIFSRLGVIFSVKDIKYQKEIDFIVYLAQKVKKDGKSSIHDDVDKLSDHFSKTALYLYIDDVDTQELNSVMEKNLQNISNRHLQGIQFFEQLAKYAPAFGLLGTVIGLIKLLANLDDPSAVGPGMSIALVTTFYGIVLSNILFLPIAGRLTTANFEELIQKEMIREGILAMSKGDSELVIREKMIMFLTKKERARVRKT